MQWVTYSSYFELLATVKWEKVRVVVMCGLPGSGKSSLGEILEDRLGYRYVSSDIARVELLKLTKGKFATTNEYLKNKELVYDYMREQLALALKENKKITLDATHLNEQRQKTLQYCKDLKLESNEVLVIFVDAGSKENVKKRFVVRDGYNQDGRSWVEAWETAYDYFVEQIKSKIVTIPENNEKGYEVIWVRNY